MKKITLAALCAASAVYAGPFVTWNGADGGVYQVETGLGNETGTYGAWYDFNDSWAYSGSSKINYKIIKINLKLSFKTMVKYGD